MSLIEILKVIFLGIVEGITEWLPISSTGHMLLVDEFIKLSMSDAFKEMFFVVIQLGAILAVVVIYWKELLPIGRQEKKLVWKKDTLSMWGKIIVACIPAGLLGVLFDDWMEEHFYTPVVIAAALIFYGVWFLVLETKNKKREPKVDSINALPMKTALLIGVFQVLSLIPGTSRSGSTIIGALLLGVSRTVAAEFTFYLAVPVMFGASFIKLLKFGFHFTMTEAAVLLLGMAAAFLVSIFVIKFLMQYIRKHDFKVFGWYRIVLGAIVLLYFGIIAK